MTEAPFPLCESCIQELMRLTALYGQTSVQALVDMGVFAACEADNDRFWGWVIERALAARVEK